MTPLGGGSHAEHQGWMTSRGMTLRPLAGVHVMRQRIALTPAFFNTHRMVQPYCRHAYALGQESRDAGAGT